MSIAGYEGTVYPRSIVEQDGDRERYRLPSAATVEIVDGVIWVDFDEASHDAPGRFELKLSGPEATVLPYRVNLPPRHEQEALGMAEEALREAARTSGGKFYREEDLYKLPEQVKPQLAPITIRSETILWNRWALFLLVGLLTLEWVVRKFNGLS